MVVQVSHLDGNPPAGEVAKLAGLVGEVLQGVLVPRLGWGGAG